MTGKVKPWNDIVGNSKLALSFGLCGSGSKKIAEFKK